MALKIEEGALCAICEKGTLYKHPKHRVMKFQGVWWALDVVVYTCNICEDGFYPKEDEKRIDAAFKALRDYKRKWVDGEPQGYTGATQRKNRV